MAAKKASPVSMGPPQRKGNIYGALHPALHARQQKPAVKEAKPEFTTPTRNPEYNRAFATWQTHKLVDKPECEDCGADLTGKQVYDIERWVCSTCKKNAKVEPSPE